MTEVEWITFLQRPEFPAFNRAMLENSDDDLPRLVFADWMDENCPDTAVNAAVRESVTGNGKCRGWPDLPANAWDLWFERGRVTAEINRASRPVVRRRARTFLEAVWKANWVETADFACDYSGIGLSRWFTDAPMESVSRIKLFCPSVGTPDRLVNLFSSPRLTNVTALEVFGWEANWCFATTLVQCHLLSHLRFLSLRKIHFAADGVAELVRSHATVQLTSLELSECDLNDSDARAIADSPWLVGLKVLKLKPSRITKVGAAALANSPYLCEAIRAQWQW